MICTSQRCHLSICLSDSISIHISRCQNSVSLPGLRALPLRSFIGMPTSTDQQLILGVDDFNDVWCWVVMIDKVMMMMLMLMMVVVVMVVIVMSHGTARLGPQTEKQSLQCLTSKQGNNHEESDDLFSPLRNLSLSRSKLVHSYTQGIRMIWA